MPPLRIDDTFEKRLDDKPARQQAAILECVQRLGDDPRYLACGPIPFRVIQGCSRLASTAQTA